MIKKFEISISNNKNYREIVIKNNKSGEYISVLPYYGARLSKAVLRKGEVYHSVLREVLPYQFNSQDDIFNNVKLFPFANRIKNGTYSYNGKEYFLDVIFEEENNACHGFIHNKEFSLTNKTVNENFAEIELVHNYEGDIEGYPFPFSIYIKYTFTNDSKVICDTKILNRSDEKLLFSDGWHHYFMLNDPVDELMLKLDVKSKIEIDHFGIPIGKTNISNNNKYEELRGMKLDTAFEVSDKDIIITEVYNPKKDLKLSVWQESGHNKYKYVLIYTTVDRNYIAVEPMTSNVNAFNNLDNLVYLKPGCAWTSNYGFSINS